LIAIHRPSAAQFRAAVRKCVVGRPRGPAPPVLIEQSPDGSLIYCNLGEVALALRQPLEPGETSQVVLPATILEEIESSKQGNALIEVRDNTGRATWEQSGNPRESTWPLIASDLAIPPLPKTLKSNDRTLLQAMFECGKTTSDGVRFATKRLQIQGKSGQIVGTDGRQLLIWNGFDVPFSDSLLLPAVPVFGLRDVAMANDVRIGKTSLHVVVAAGPWTVWLLIDKNGRFPNVESVVPRDAAHVLRLDHGDRQKAAEFCSQAVAAEDDPVSVTVEFGASPALRRKSSPESSPEEIRLDHSRCEGEPVTFVLNRDHLLRALLLSVRDIRTPAENGPAVFQDERRTYVTTALVPSQAIPAIRPVTTALARRKQFIPISQGAHPMATETNGRGIAHDSESAEPLDFMAEAEGLRDALIDVARRAGRLVTLLKHLQKQRRVLETAWSSLKNLRLGS
jgi:hypothetical protein